MEALEARGYQDAPENDQQCSECTKFQPPKGCSVVSGDISPKFASRARPKTGGPITFALERGNFAFVGAVKGNKLGLLIRVQAALREYEMSARVLIVDDDEAYRYATVKMLAEAGFETVEAPDYRRALEILDDKKPLALLVMDIVIPGVNGFALARMARMRHRDLKVIYVSAFDVPTNEAIGPVLRKPVEGEGLMAEIRKALAATA